MFIHGKIYRRKDIHADVGGQEQGGISTPSGQKVILVFTGQQGEQYGYQDEWIGGDTFLYTGEGQVGDMTFRAGNKAIRDHLQTGKDLHLFKYVSQGHCQYVGQMVCTGHQYHTRPDRSGAPRQVIVFELSPVEAVTVPDAIAPPEMPSPGTLEVLRRKAMTVPTQGTNTVERKTIIRERSADVKRYVLARAAGTCEACGAPAPFKTAEGSLYLETHHIHRLSDGGPDQPRFVAGLCPNCHRRAHYSHDQEAFNAQLEKEVNAKED